MENMEKTQAFICISLVLIVMIMATLILEEIHQKSPYKPREHAEFSDGVVTATFDKKTETLTFSGDGAVIDTFMWIDLRHEEEVFVRKIVFERGITSIGELEFRHVYINLEKVIFQGDINTIDSFAFEENSNLTTVEFKGDCRTIKPYAFDNCSALENINIPENCVVDEHAFDASESEEASDHQDPREVIPTEPTMPSRPTMPTEPTKPTTPTKP